MKIRLLVAFLSLVSIQLISQKRNIDTPVSTDQQYGSEFDVRFGGSISYKSVLKETSGSGTSLSAAFDVSFPMTESLDLRTGMFYLTNNSDETFIQFDPLSSNPLFPNFSTDFSTPINFVNSNAQYIGIPISAVYNLQSQNTIYFRLGIDFMKPINGRTETVFANSSQFSSVSEPTRGIATFFNAGVGYKLEVKETAILLELGAKGEFSRITSNSGLKVGSGMYYGFSLGFLL